MDIISIISLVIAILGIYPLILFIISLINKPKLVIGLLPFYELDNGLSFDLLGKPNIFDEFKFNEKIFSKKIKKFNSKKLKKFKLRNRKLLRTSSNEYDIPIIIYNDGRTDLMDYNLVISFRELDYDINSNIKILEAESESAKIDALYVDNSYIGTEGQELIPDDRIINYYNKLGLSSHLIIFAGSVESTVYEMLYLKLLVPPDVSCFGIFYKIYPINNWEKTNRYAQLVEVIDK